MPRPLGELLAGQHRSVEDNERERGIGAAEDGAPQSVEVLSGFALRAGRQCDELAVDDAVIGQQLDELAGQVADARS